MMNTFTRAAVLVSLAALLATLAGCETKPAAPKAPETIEVEKRAGDFLDYYGEVLRLSHEYAAHPDSFRAALDSLPGSHLSEKEWEAWIAPYRDDPRVVSERLEKVIAGLKQEGMSILLTESDLSHSREMLDALFVIDRGEVSPGTV